MILRLERSYIPKLATFGLLTLPDGLQLYTVECPWMDNLPGVSCIPEGTYPLQLGRFHRKNYETWEIPDGAVPGRTLIKFHAANLASELRGCIAPGLGLGVVHGEWGVTRSRVAHGRLMTALQGAQRVRLVITQHRPPHMTTVQKDQGSIPEHLGKRPLGIL